jgi:radical SAM superfamily enzyme YgiQ (UPF0313 family)
VFFLFVNVNHDVGFESSESLPISLGYILAALKARGHDGLIVDDLRDRTLTLGDLERLIMRHDPALIGFTAYQSTMERIRYLCRYIKSRHRRIKIALGGPQALLMPSAALGALEDVDVLVRQDGEHVMPLVAEALARDSGLETVPGIACKCGGGILDTDFDPAQPTDLDEYPSPYLADLFDLTGKDTAILLSSRGCGHYCRFCITPGVCKGKVRFHSVERTLDEMEFLADKGIQRFWFADPSFTENRERIERLIEGKIRRGVNVPFWFQTRCDLIDPPLLEKLKGAGADTVAFGLESGSPGVLKAINKGIALRQVQEHVAAAQALGMQTELFTIFGLPHETVKDARETLTFVKSLGIPIHSNSGSQQMQLYFGSAYARNPEAFGFKPLSEYRPLYLSVGDRYETAWMTSKEIRKVKNLWALANEQMEQDVYLKTRVFEILDFLLTNWEDLAEEPTFYVYGALTSSALEEFDLLVRFLEGFAELVRDPEAETELIGALNFFRESKKPIEPTDRIIFDCRSRIDGVPFTGVTGKYWDVLLGRGLLLEEFERGFLGALEGDSLSFSFGFPDDYGEAELQGKQVEVSASVRKVFKAEKARTLEEVRRLGIRNHYPFPDLDTLREQNDILYYFALRDTSPETLLKNPTHFLTYTHKIAKLGKEDVKERLARAVEDAPQAIGAFAETLAAAGKCEWADPFFESLSRVNSAYISRRAMCLLARDEAARALELLSEGPEFEGAEFQETLLECLMKTEPDSPRIPSLSRHVMDMRVTHNLKREAFQARGAGAPAPLIHGAFETHGAEPH